MSIKSSQELVAEAEAEVTTLNVAAAQEAVAAGALLIDLRDVRELRREGKIPGAYHAPRGLLEFWVDPQSPYHRSELSPDRPFVLFCAAGWRSALAAKALQDMGLTEVSHLGGGFTAWKEAGAPVEPPATG